MLDVKFDRHAFIIPVTRNYLNKARIFVKSISDHMPDADIWILTHYTEERKVGYNDFADLGIQNSFVVTTCPKSDTEFREVRTYRFKFAIEISQSQGYDSIGLFDADMLLLRPIYQFFNMAKGGAILVSNNNTLLKYEPKHFKEYGFECDRTVIWPTICTVPLFINAVLHKDYLNAVWEHPSGNDLEIPSMLLPVMNLDNLVHYLNSYCWTNIHHTMLKPETFVKDTQDGLFSHQGDPIYILHGHWDDDNYVEQLIEPMKKNYGHIPKAVEIAENSIEILRRYYAKYKDEIVCV